MVEIVLELPDGVSGVFLGLDRGNRADSRLLVGTGDFTRMPYIAR